MNNPRQILPKHLPQLSLNLPLYELLNDGDRVECGVDVDVLERVGLEDEGYTFLFGDDEDDVGV